MGKTGFKKLQLPSLHLPFLKRQTLSIGLDIGSHAVKICELAESGQGYQLVALGSALLPPDSLEDGALQNPEAVARVITSLISNLKIKNKKVAISISGYSVIVKKINLAVMSEEALEKHIESEAEQYIPFDIEDVYLDFQDLKTNTTAEDRTDVMLVAAKRDVVDGYLNMLRGVGLQPVVVDVDAFALENAFEANFGMEDNVALVDIGASKMNINIISHGASILARDVVLGSRQLTEQIENLFGVSFEEAEALKTGEIASKEKQKELETLFANTCNQWVTEVKRAIDFYYSNHPDETITKIVLSGGGANIQGLTEFFEKETDIPVEMFNPFTQAEVDSRAIDPSYLKRIASEMTLAAGLATRPVEV
ncbi:MAG: pilus assembly protein PilM [Desulfobulbaceae bacterium]|nr:pilus assembly protein PilM [Desulfobulbaceae bacterium]HIJ89281.1 type IV pilus assembly protein PilM [Deltaproteobacteria bacterium]